MSYNIKSKMFRHTQTLFPSMDEDVGVTSKTLEGHRQDIWSYSLIGLVLFVAFILNILVIVVYRGRWRKSTNLFILALAFTDIFNCLINLLDIVFKKGNIDNSVLTFYMSTRQLLISFGSVMSAVLVVCITVYRFIKIPSKPGVTRLGIKKKGFMTLSAILLSIVVSTPFAIIHAVYGKSSKLTNVTFNREDRSSNKTDNVGQLGSVNNRQNNLTAIHQQAKPEVTSISASGENLCMFIFHVVVAVKVLMAFLCVMIMNFKLIYTLMQNGFRMSKHSRQNRGAGGIQLVGEQNSNLPSGTNESQTSRGSDPMDRVELRKKLSGIIAKQIAHVRNQNRRSILSSQLAVKQRTSSKTIAILFLAVLLFLFNIPPLCLNILLYVQPSITLALQTKSNILFSILQYSYVVCFLGNPIIYAFFNQEFLRNLSKICCVKKSPSLPRQRKQTLILKRTSTVTHYNPDVWYPTLAELEARTTRLTGL